MKTPLVGVPCQPTCEAQRYGATVRPLGHPRVLTRSLQRDRGVLGQAETYGSHSRKGGQSRSYSALFLALVKVLLLPPFELRVTGVCGVQLQSAAWHLTA